MLYDALTQLVDACKSVPGKLSQGLFYGQKRAVSRQPVRQLQPTQPQDDDADMLQSSGWVDVVKSFMIGPIGIFGSLALAIILGYGNGYLFSGFKDIDWTQAISIVVYAGGYIMEFIGIALLYRASQAIQNKEKHLFAVVFCFGLLLMSVSWLAQYLLLEDEFMKQVITFPDAAIEAMPVVGGMILGLGMHGHDAVFIVRAAVFHLGELACVFLIPVKQPDVEKTVAQAMQRSIGKMQVDGAKAVQTIMADTYGMANAMMQDITAQARQTTLAQRSVAANVQPPQQAPTTVTETLPYTAMQQEPPRVVQRPIPPPQQPVKKKQPETAVPLLTPVVVEKDAQEGGETAMGEQLSPSPSPLPFPEIDPKQRMIKQWGWDKYGDRIVTMRRISERKDAIHYIQTYHEYPPSFTPEEVESWGIPFDN